VRITYGYYEDVWRSPFWTNDAILPHTRGPTLAAVFLIWIKAPGITPAEADKTVQLRGRRDDANQ
jgi:hypothetical protein